MQRSGWHLPFMLAVLVTSHNVVGNIVSSDAFEMGRYQGHPSPMLFVASQSVSKERAEFMAQLRSFPKNQRPLYERYIDVIGANGILDGLEHLWPKCHSQAHDLGKVVFARVRDIGTSLRICAGRCHSGCMHGILMEAFADTLTSEAHADLASLKPVMNALCQNHPEMISSYSPGDCAHGVGHALMFLADYHISDALETCREFTDQAMAYYCVTGAYMEYVTERDRADMVTQSLFYPCDTFAYPAACFRYKMAQVARRHYWTAQQPTVLIHACAQLHGKFRRGCFHGLGNAYMHPIAQGHISIKTICLHGTDEDQFMCIEGTMERMAKYYEARAVQVCADLHEKNQDICLRAVQHKMYNLNKDLSLYLAE